MKKKKIVGIILLLAIWVLPSRAQVGEQRHNLAIGFNGGINLNSINFSPTIQYWADYAEMAGIEMVVIDENTTISEFKKELRMNEVYYMLNKALC